MLTSEEIVPEPRDSSPIRAAGKRIGRIVRAEPADDAVLAYGEKANLALRFLNERTVRILLFETDRPDWGATPAVTDGARAALPADLRETEDAYVIRSGALEAVLRKRDASLVVRNAEGTTLLDGAEWSWEKKKIEFTDRSGAASHFYGLGEKTGFLDKRGERYRMWNSDVYEPHVPDTDALYQSIPFLVHFREGGAANGIFLDNPGRTHFDMRASDDRYTIGAESGAMDLYLIDGPGLKEVVSRYAELTGKPPMPPRWALGYQQSRYSYETQEEVLKLARTFRRKRIPCDVIYLDIHYMDEYRVFTWDPDRFPDPAGMMRELAEMGFRIVPIVDPGVKKDPNYRVYREGVDGGFFCRKLEGELFIGAVWPGPSAFPDFTDDAAAKWWGDLHRFYIGYGISGIWNDMNEPSVFNDTTKTMDLDVMHANGGRPATHEELHNLYGMMMSKATYEGLARGLEGERPFVLTRAGYAGIQRYAAVWTGDNRSYWEHMEMSVPMVLNLGLSGVAFAGADVGGFSHDASGELVARWTQMGALFPFCRNHSVIGSRLQEPWRFGERVEAVCREAISLRYRLMPYLYSLFYEASVTGLPVLRPLVLEYPEDPAATNLSDQFLLGEFLLAAPVFRPGAAARAVYLPAGVWYDGETGERHEGGRHVLAEAPLEKMPLYVKAGAIVPTRGVSQFADEPGADELTLSVYAGSSGESRFRLFEDDGRTFAYREGAYRLREFAWNESGAGASLKAVSLHDEFEGASAKLGIVVKQLAPAPAAVVFSGDLLEPGEWRYDAELRELRLNVEAKGGFRLDIEY
ncbi:TIM-barrel domain-containing protein [Cohnella caldifontis]|uniref:glycoside hydrolase family 31 protein n=1 Tax=Cohnella caldifontis TaxID=3027471 RepID=UPI0023ED6087|nr:TIM-barrel domain-containing protein [Cohnella sp. YIM B05605]